MHLTPQMKMSDVIHMDYLLLPVVNRFGFTPGFGDQTIDELCKQHKVEPEFFIEIVKTYHDKNYFPEKKLKSFNIPAIIDYLRKTHQYYHNQLMVSIEQLFDELMKSSKSNNETWLLIKKFFNDYKKEFYNHMKSEELLTFPYVLEIDKVFKSNDIESYKRLKNTYSMKKFGEEHSDIEEKIYDFKNILIKYLPPPFEVNVCNRLIVELARFEKDLSDHARIEELILKPVVEEMERKLNA